MGFLVGFVELGSTVSSVSILSGDVGGENFRPSGISCVTFGTTTSGSKISDSSIDSDSSPSPLAS